MSKLSQSNVIHWLTGTVRKLDRILAQLQVEETATVAKIEPRALCLDELISIERKWRPNPSAQVVVPSVHVVAGSEDLNGSEEVVQMVVAPAFKAFQLLPSVGTWLTLPPVLEISPTSMSVSKCPDYNKSEGIEPRNERLAAKAKANRLGKMEADRLAAGIAAAAKANRLAAKSEADHLSKIEAHRTAALAAAIAQADCQAADEQANRLAKIEADRLTVEAAAKAEHLTAKAEASPTQKDLTLSTTLPTTRTWTDEDTEKFTKNLVDEYRSTNLDLQSRLVAYGRFKAGIETAITHCPLPCAPGLQKLLDAVREGLEDALRVKHEGNS